MLLKEIAVKFYKKYCKRQIEQKLDIDTDKIDK